MYICFTIGTTELKRVEFRFDQWLTGRYVVRVDNECVLRGFRIASASRAANFEFKVGQPETYSVRIEKRKRRIFGGLLPQTYGVFVNDSLLFTVTGY